MPGKSRRKGKYSVQNTKKGKPAQAKAVIQPASATQVNQPAAVSSPPPSTGIVPDSSRVVAARPARGAQTVKLAAMPPVFLKKELRTIGILAAAMLVIVIVLARVLG